jgi:hypothetical protein
MTPHLKTVLATVALVLVLAVAIRAHAHHRNILAVLSGTMKLGDYDGIRAVFSEAGWTGSANGIAGQSLRELTKGADHVALSSGATNGKHMVMGMKFYRTRRSKPKWIFGLAFAAEKPVRVQFGGKSYLCHWQLRRLTRSLKEAEKYLGKPLKYGDLPAKAE